MLLVAFVGSAVLAGGTVYIVVMLYLTTQYQSVQVSPPLLDLSGLAKDEFLRLLDDAQQSVFVIDDGDQVGDSIYEDPQVLDSIANKLRGDRSFKIYCVFNIDVPELRFRREFAASFQDQVFVHALRSDEKNIDTHCKMIDGGLCARLSWHATGAKERIYRTVDCSRTLRPWRSRVIRNSLGPQLDIFDRYFRQQAVFA